MGEHLHPSIEGTVGQPLSAPFPKLCLTLIGKSEPVLVILKITAEAVEKRYPPDHFFPDVCLHRSTQKINLTDYNL